MKLKKCNRKCNNEKKVLEKIIQIESSFLYHYKQHQAHT